MKNLPREKLNSIEKTLEILIAFIEGDHEMGTVEVSELTGIHKATTSRILATLVDYGMVTQNYETRKYNLGPLAYRFAITQFSRAISAIVNVSRQHIDELRDRVDESISLEMWAENKTIACYMAESRNPLRVAEMKVDVLPLHAPAGAKAILAFVSIDHVGRLLPEEFPKLTNNTITSKTELLSRLEVFNQQGYSVDNEEFYDGVYAIGVPIFDYLGQPIAAIVAVLPVARITPEREQVIVKDLKKTARVIGRDVKANPSLFLHG